MKASAATVALSPSETRDLTEDRAVFERLYDDHVDFVWRSARRLGVAEETADDVVQQVFVVVHRRLSEWSGRSSIKTWLFAILLRVVRDHRRTLRRKSPHLATEATDPDTLADSGRAADPYETLSLVEASLLINRLLGALDEERREVFVMAELEQMTPAEISEAIGLDVKTIYARLRAARLDFEDAAARLRKREKAGEGR